MFKVLFCYLSQTLPVAHSKHKSTLNETWIKTINIMTKNNNMVFVIKFDSKDPDKIKWKMIKKDVVCHKITKQNKIKIYKTD